MSGSRLPTSALKAMGAVMRAAACALTLASIGLLAGAAPGCAGSLSRNAAEAAAEQHAGAHAASRVAAQQAAAAERAQLEAEALAYTRAYQVERAAPAGSTQHAMVASAAGAAATTVTLAMAENAQRQAQVQVQAQAAGAKSAAEAAAAAARQQEDARATAAFAKATAEAQAAQVKVAQARAAGAATAGTEASEATAGAVIAAPAAMPPLPSTSTSTAVAPTEDFTGLVAEIRTSQGVMVLSFRPDKAPNHVQNFVKLARAGFYDGLTFHKVDPLTIQGGDPKGDGSGGPAYFIPNEFNALPHERGTLSMARLAHPDTAGSQFFICAAPRPELDGKYTVFGKLVQGEDTLDRIAAFGSPGGTPRETITIETILIRPATPKG